MTGGPRRHNNSKERSPLRSCQDRQKRLTMDLVRRQQNPPESGRAPELRTNSYRDLLVSASASMS